MGSETNHADNREVFACYRCAGAGSAAQGLNAGSVKSWCQPGTGYYWPRYPYTNDDIRKDSELTLQNNYVCKWDVTLDGIGQGTNQGILYLPPCTWITPHWHPTTYELNFVL